MQKIVNRFGYRKTKWGMIALIIILTIAFAVSLYCAIVVWHNFNTYTTITM